MAKSNGEPSERVILGRFKKALCIYETEEAIDSYIASRADLVAVGALGTKAKIPLAKIIEMLRRREDCALVSVDWAGDAGEKGIRERIDYLDESIIASSR